VFGQGEPKEAPLAEEKEAWTTTLFEAGTADDLHDSQRDDDLR
jgi:hypothetical protein